MGSVAVIKEKNVQTILIFRAGSEKLLNNYLGLLALDPEKIDNLSFLPFVFMYMEPNSIYFVVK